MAKEFWAKEEASKILARRLPNQSEFIFETGYGPSGLPHIGTFAEVARAKAVILALKELAPGMKTRLIAFSDDRDGLRKLPPNIPNHDLLKPYLGKPLSRIPDPFGEKDSFAGYMNAKLQSFLDFFGFSYEYISSSEFYEAGKLDLAMHEVAVHYDEIIKIMTDTMREENREGWSPFMPICEKCGRIYTTKVIQVDPIKNTIIYKCCLEDPRFPFCGHEGEIAITGKNLKLGWKVDWAARWWALNVDYELHGEDLTDSVSVSRKVVKVLGKPGPITFKYELFLDEHGLKISKTKGNSITIDDWLRYAPINALLYFILDNPAKPKRMGLAILPKLIDEYFQAARQGASLTLQSPLWYISKLYPAQEKYDFAQLSYNLLVNVIESLHDNDPALLKEYVYQYDPSLKDNIHFENLLEKALAYTKDVQSKLPKGELIVDEKYLPYLKDFQTYLANQTTLVASEAQSKLFALAKDNGLEMKDWFKFCYQKLFHKNEGPKLGPYFGILGLKKSREIVEKALE